jgi:hypothetical protein
MGKCMRVQLRDEPWNEMRSKGWKNGTDERGGLWNEELGGEWVMS